MPRKEVPIEEQPIFLLDSRKRRLLPLLRLIFNFNKYRRGHVIVRLRRNVCFFFSICFLVSPLGFAASSFSETGSISGRVRDWRGKKVSGVALVLRHQEEASQQEELSDSSGAFQFEKVQPAHYSLTAKKHGFESFRKEIFLSPNDHRKIEITLGFTPEQTIHHRVMVIGDPSGVDTIPGSAHYLDQDQMDRHRLDYDDVHHFLRQIPGINIQEEDGYGLRPNIGMRGTGVERSSKITIMEDGVLISPAPYAAPSAYYFPITGRMEALEVRKGSSQIKYGPRTNGGALNLISTRIPTDLALGGNLALGANSTRKLHLNLGDSYKNFGWVAETYQIATDGFKQLDGGGDTGFDVNDYMGKFRFNTSGDSRIYQEVEIKLGKTQQLSDETYLGLTDADFSSNPFRRYRSSQLDQFRSDHEQYQARHFIAPSSKIDVTTLFYRNNFQRNWYKLQSVSGTSIDRIFNDTENYPSQLALIKGSDSDPDELAVRANNRGYYSQGIQSVLGLHLDQGKTRNSFEIGLRYHEDQEDRFQHEDKFQMQDGRMALTTRGTPGSQSNRISGAQAWAFFVQDRIEWGRWSVVPGLRYENVDLVRTDFSRTDPDRVSPAKIRKNAVNVFIPGVGLNFDVNPKLGLFGGVHKGFSPPGPGSTEDTRAEESLNYELGFRLQGRPLSLQVAAFVTDYDNLLGADLLAIGGTGEGDFFNGGKAYVKGLEASGAFDVGQALGSSFRIPARFAYTFSDSAFQESFQSQFSPWGNVTSGDALPYLPRHQFHAGIGLEKARWRLLLQANSVSRMRTQAGQGPISPFQATDAYLVFNLSGEYDLSLEEKRVSLFLTFRNLTDQHYIVARRPAGVRPGLPRTLMGGIRFRLGRL